MKKMAIINFRAFFWHFLASISVIGLISLFVLTIWFPKPWSSELGGYDLFIKIVLFDLFVGPLCVGLTYKATKTKLANSIDIIVISLCQLVFIGYGLWVISESRPAYIVFVKDRLDVLVVNEIDPVNFADSPPFNRFSHWGPIFAAIDTDKVNIYMKENPNFLVDLVVTGIDISAYPKYFTKYSQQKDEILRVAHSYSLIPEGAMRDQAKFILEKHHLTEETFLWLPVKHRFGFITAVLDPITALPLDYIMIDSYEVLEEGNKNEK